MRSKATQYWNIPCLASRCCKQMLQLALPDRGGEVCASPLATNVGRVSSIDCIQECRQVSKIWLGLGLSMYLKA